ncbi:hypothetical protein [uncultured Winogradskyella sp.]|uniref:hypothetical protein n=1 Tax=uncultured Winogradskyella sp. TaxID=395353 RepID=UPI0030DD1874
MKQIFTLLSVFVFTTSLWAQSPEQMNYQAVVRNSADELVTNTNLGMQISILEGTVDGTAVYVETQTPTTNGNGLVSIMIGTGITSDDFNAIDWSIGPYFIKTETDPTGGSNYTITGTSQLVSVPYALYAKSAGFVNETDPTLQTNFDLVGATDGDILRYNATTEKWTKVTSDFITEESQTLSSILNDNNSAANEQIIDLADPTEDQDAANKRYIDDRNFTKDEVNLLIANLQNQIDNSGGASLGDVKSGIQAGDHNGWVLLNGRALSQLSSSQESVAITLNLSGNLPDATNAYLVQNGGTIASVTGTNTTTLTQANLPNTVFTGNTNSRGDHSHSGIATTGGSHTHTGDTNTAGNHSHNANGGGAFLAGTGQAAGSLVSGGTAKISLGTSTDGNHTHNLSINSSGAHTHGLNMTSAGIHAHNVTVNSGGTNEPINIKPRSLSVNMFIFLGL